jgi:hypothetical protein
LTLGSAIENTTDRNYSIGDLAEVRDNGGAITDLNAAMQGVVPTIVTGITASGTNQATATPLVGNNSVQEVTTVSSGQGVSLPTPALPASIIVVNASETPLLVYPPIAGTIFNASTPVTLAGGTSASWVASSTTNWYPV